MQTDGYNLAKYYMLAHKLNPQENIVVNNKKSCNEKINDIDISLAI